MRSGGRSPWDWLSKLQSQSQESAHAPVLKRLNDRAITVAHSSYTGTCSLHSTGMDCSTGVQKTAIKQRQRRRVLRYMELDGTVCQTFRARPSARALVKLFIKSLARQHIKTYKSYHLLMLLGINVIFLHFRLPYWSLLPLLDLHEKELSPKPCKSMHW